MTYRICSDEFMIYVDSATKLRETLESLLAAKFGNYVMLQEDTEDDGIEIYLHSEFADELEENEIEQLEQLGITECNSLDNICDYLGISIDVAVSQNYQGKVWS